ncbi:MAG: DUF302 domain-containing protein [Pseudomonadota bacterium]
MRVAILLICLMANPASAEMAERPGWAVTVTDKPYDELVSDVKDAVRANGMGVVTEAGPTGVARSRGIEIPGNRVIGVFNNTFAVRILGHSTPAMIEAPIRLYVTENADGTATLSYKLPSTVFAPYMDGADPDFAAAAAELDEIFARIASEAVP